MSGRPVEDPSVIEEPVFPEAADRPAISVAGIGPRTADRLEELEIFTVRDFLTATATPERVSRLVDILRSAGARASEDLVLEWRGSALSFLRENG